MFSFGNSRRNILCFYAHQRWLTKSTFSHRVTCVACLWFSEFWILFTSMKLLFYETRPALHFMLYMVAFMSCMKYSF